MKHLFTLLFSLFFQLAFCQLLTISTAHKMLTTKMSIDDAKKIVLQNYDFISEDGPSASGNIAYMFESKTPERYTLAILYSTAFDRICYIQIYDNLKQIGLYRNQFIKLGFKYLKTDYSTKDLSQKYGYEKGTLLYVAELGKEPGQCKIHLKNRDF